MITKVIISGIMFVSLVRVSNQNREPVINPFEPIPIEDYIRYHGYPVEAHEIITADGYILTYHRIPHGKYMCTSGAVRRPVLLQHGLLASSAAWVLTSQALGYLLADAGFDLWLGNARGNTYSRRNTKYDPDRDKREFWTFSWHEMGYYDLPASIDYILNVTKQRELLYIGHSMGTTMFFVLGATRPEYMAKVQAAVLMAPVAFPWNMKTPVIVFFCNTYKFMKTFFDGIVDLLNIHELLPYSRGLYWLKMVFCANKIMQFLCKVLIFEVAGFDSIQLNKTVLPLALDYLPAGTSVKELQHFSQIIGKGLHFGQFDYGTLINEIIYHQPKPPAYNLTNVNTSLFLHYGDNDWISVPKDVFYTAKRLPNVQGVRKVPFDLFNHLDFMWASEARKYVYDNIIKTLKNITSPTGT